MSERWVDELMPDEPQWVRDLVDDELRKRDARLAEVQTELDQTIEDAAKKLNEQGARLAEAIAVLERAKKDALHINKQVSTFGLAHGMVARIDAFLAPDSAPAVRCPATLGNAGQCVKEAGHDGQHSLVDVTRPDDRWAAADKSGASK